MSSFFWLLLVFSKTTQKGRVFLLLLSSLLTLSFFGAPRLNSYLIIYIFIGDILVVFLITCLRERKKSGRASFWGAAFGGSFLLLLRRNHWALSSVSLLSRGLWLEFSLVLIIIGVALFSKTIPKTQARLL